MKKVKECLAALSDPVTMTKKEKVMTIALAAMTGLVIGMLISPRKTTSICCGNDNGNYYPADEARDEEA